MTGNVVIIGSDLHPPCQSMEAGIADVIVRNIPELTFARVSICVGKPATAEAGFVFIDGLRHWPLLIRKIFYAFKLAFVIVRLRLQGFRVFHFIWNGPVWLMRTYTMIIHLVEGKSIVTVLNRFLNPAAYVGSDAVITHSTGMTEILKQLPGMSEHAVYTIPLPLIDSSPVPVDMREPIRKHFLYLSAPKSHAQLRSRGVYLLIETFKLLSRDPDAPALKVFGRWPEGDAGISKMFHDSGITLVDWSSGYVENVRQEIHRSLGIILPYIGDTAGDVPLSGLEAAAAGRVVITTPGLGLAEFLSGYPGYFEVEPEPEKLAAAIKHASTVDMENLRANVPVFANMSDREYADRHAMVYRETGYGI